MEAVRNEAIADADEKIVDEAELSRLSASKKQEAKEILVHNEMERLAENASSQLTYAGILPDVDLKYRVLSGELKEDIILNRYQEDFRISFQINTKGLGARLEKDNTITFYDVNDPSKVIFTTEAPYMYDQGDVFSTNVSVTLEEAKDGYRLTLIPEDAWLADAARSWPVVIDPVVRTKSTRKLIRDTFVSSDNPTADYHQWDTFRTGYDGIYEKQRGYIKFDLPVLSSSSMVTYAELQLYSRSVLNGGTQVNIHKVKDAWESETINWSNMPGYDGTIVDYKVVNASNKWYSFDITSIAKDWYSQEVNKGLMLKGKDETVGVTEFLSSDYSDAVGRPVAWIRYVDFAGLEEYWTYHSQDVMRAGTGYINDYNGNIVFLHDDLSMTGNLMPLSVSHVFNSNNKSENTGFGSGWRLNLSQRVVEGSGSGGDVDYDVEDPYAYYYIDGDGTKHYFNEKDSSDAYKDESGLNITLTKNSDGSYTIKDTKDNLLKFRSDGYLSTINDNNSNKITLNYSGTVLTGATDGAGRVTTFTYTNGKLSKLKDPAGRETLYEYTGTNLTKITYPDNKASNYTYDGNGNLTQITNYDGYRITYSYSTSEIKRVTKAAESHTDGTKGGELAISYGFNKTTFTDAIGRKDIYQFNDYGNTLSIRDSDGSAQYYEYGTGSMVNKLTSQSLLQKTTANYVKNHNIEQDSGFTLYSNGGIGTGSYTSESSYLGSRSLKITKTDNQNAQLYYQKFKAEVGKTYTYSAYVRTLDISSANNQGAYLQAWYTDNAGVIQSVRSEYLSGSNEWTRLETTLTVPEGITDNTITLRAGIQSETGTAYFDNLQFEEGYVANRYNLVENGDFREASAAFWSTTGLETGDGIINDSVTKTAPAVLDANSFKLGGSSQKTKNINQTIKVSGKAEDIFVISAWAKAASVPLTDTARKFALKLEFVNTDGTKTPVEIPFNQDSTDWQYVSGKAIAGKEYNSVIIYGIYDRNENMAYFDGFRLYKEEFGQSYTYDDKGNIISTKDIANEKSTFDYNGKNDLIESTDPKGSNFEYEYNNGEANSTRHNLTKATTAENVIYSFHYDSKGNALWSRIDGTDIYTQSDATYTSDGNYISQMQDADGNTVDYDYNTTKGTLNSVADANGNVTDYSYDTMDRLTSVSKEVDGETIANSYTYEKDRLKSITHNGFSYNFTYDVFGNNKNVSVGNQSLITNTFESKTNNLLQSEYGNGQKVNYVYDTLDRLIELKSGSSTTNKYRYDAEGNLAYHEDLVNNVSYRYYYDLSGRITEKKDSAGNITQYSYDSNSNINKLLQNIGGINYSTKYRYDKDNRPISVAYNPNKNNIHDRLGDNLIAYYSFDNNDVSDESGNGNNGTLKGDAVFTNGKYGRALKLDWSDAWAELPDFDVPETFTLSMWVNPYTTNDDQAFVGKHTANGGNIFLMGNWSGTSQLRIRSVTKTHASKTTGYQHLVAVVKKISDTQSSVKYYKDNVLLWSTTMNDVIGNTSGKGWALGQEWDGATLSDFFNGEIDEVAFYSKDLSAAEVGELYNTAYGQTSQEYVYDSLGRLDSKQTSTGSSVFNTEYTYEAGITKDTDGTLGKSTTTKVNSINNDGNAVSYSYDRNGNISTITEDKDKLLAYYSFDHEDIADESGNGNDGTARGGITYVNSTRGKAAKFDGIDDWAELTDFDVPESFTVSMWLEPDNTDDGQAFLGKHTKDGDNIFLLGNWSGTSQLRIRSVVNTEAPKLAGYQHIVAVVKKISDTQSRVKYYRNNVLLWERTMNDVMGIIAGKAWTLGQEWDGDSTTDYFKGSIDEVAFYRDDLTQSEVSALYTQGVIVDRNDTQMRYQYNELNELTKEETKVRDGLIAYYSFDGSDAKDDSGNGNDGTLTGSPNFIAGVRGNAIELDGTDDYVELTDFDVPDSFAMSFWVNPYDTNTNQYFVSKHTEAGGNILLAGLYNGKDHLSLRGGTLDNDKPATTGYQHWVINVSRVSQTQSRIRFIKNNELIKDVVVDKTLDNIKGRPWLIGQEWDGDTPSDLTKGAIDEVAFFDHNLTWNEIQDINTNGITVNKGKTVDYTYDQGGNITSKTETTYNPITGEASTDTISYEYGDTNWKDKLTSYDGKTITYDEIGNPLTYDGYSYSWENGRQFAEINGNGLTITYKYIDAGIRTQKTVNGVITSYFLDGDQVIYEESYNVSNPSTKFDKIYYTYDSNNNLVSMNLDGVVYYYIKNAQGDITGLYNKDGIMVASYSYDSSGKSISIKDQNGNDVKEDDTSVGYKNPYRYRGYRYDTETGLYYLQSRYYNPEWGRFVNADVLIDNGAVIIGHNMYAYCINNPVNMIDVDGYAPAYINAQENDTKVTINGKKKKMKDIKFGPFGNIASNGCGVIAAYNVLLSLSSKVDFGNVKNKLDGYFGALAGGRLGLDPMSLTLFMQSKFWYVTTAGPITTLWGIKAKYSEAVIILFKWKGELNAHYIAGIGTGKDNKFIFYNTYIKNYNGQKITMNEMLNRLKKEGTPLYMIGVSHKRGSW